MPDRIQTGPAQVVGHNLPSLFGAAIILFAGYMLAKVLERLTERWLRRDRPTTPRAPARLVFWFVMIAVILVAVNALGLDSGRL